MNDLLLIILLSILSTFIFFSFAYILIKKLKINHPKDKFRIYAVVICSYIFIFLISISVIATPIEKQIINSDSSNLNNDETCSLLIVIDENQLENQNNEEFENHDCEINSCCEDECSTLSHNGSYSFFLHSSDDMQNLISKIIEIKTNTFKKIDSNKQVYEKSVVAGLSDPKVKENEKSNIGIIFLQFNIILLFLSASYLFFSLTLNKKLILKNIDGKECSDTYILDMVENLCKELKIKTPKIFTYNGKPNAFVFGYPISLVLSKKLINNLLEKELKIAIRHELAHIVNNDYLIKPILQSLRIMFFYNPFIHLIYYNMMRERELLADSKFIKSKDEKIKFMELLLKINDLSKNQYPFSNRAFGSSSLLLLSHKLKKLDISDRYNQLFSPSRNRSFITILICFLVFFSNISFIALATNNLIDHPIEIHEEYNSNICIEELKQCCVTQELKDIYILRFINQKTHLLDKIELDG